MRHIGLALVLVGCAHNVPQDKATGPDGRQKGAIPIALENNEGKAKGIVTYPGGDRVDWKSIQIPDGEHGTLDLSLSWKTPRPGLRVAFDVFDQWNTPLVSKAALHKQGHTQMTTLVVKQGTYFVRIYAPKRSDAGQYKLEANFTPDPPPDGGPAIPDPPKLPAVPVPEQDCAIFDPKVPACQPVCPDFGAPPGWKACVDRDKKTAEEAARDAAYKECLERVKKAPKPVDKRILGVNLVADDAQITLGIGTDVLDATWSAQVVSSDTNKPMPGGTVRIIRVGKTQTLASVKLTTDTLNRNPMVRFSPPAPETCTR